MRGIIVAAAALALAGCGGSSAPAGTASSANNALTVSGTFSMASAREVRPGVCGAVGAGYRDITQNTQVVVSDASGKALGFTTLGVGTWTGGKCLWTFEVKDLPRGAGPYSVEVGRRGALRYTEEQIDGQTVEISLG